MTRYWTCHWQNQYWSDAHNPEGEAILFSGSNRLAQRGVAQGDFLYIISILDGSLLLGGRMTIERVVSRKEAIARTGNPNLYESADLWALGIGGTGTPLRLHRRLAADVTSRLRFITKDGLKGLAVVAHTNDLDPQTTRGVRELWHKSAELLDKVIAATDPPEGNRWTTVTAKSLGM